MSNKEKNKIPFLPRRPFKEVDKNEDKTPNIKYYFKSFGRRFSKIISINLMMLFMVIPIIAAVFAYILLMPRIFVFTDTFFPALNGIGMMSDSPIVDTLINIMGNTMEVTTIAPGAGLIVMITCALFLMITYGWQNVGATYLMRELFNGRSVFVFSDYIYGIKRSFRQGFIIGLIDFAVSAILIFDFMYFYNLPPQIMTDLMFWAICGVSVIYILMRFYIYLVLVTFDLPIKKIFKNALIFTALGIKRNLLASLWIVLIGVLNGALALALMGTGIIIPAVLPLFYFLGFALYTTVYAAYPVIDKYMIKPYYDEYGNPISTDEEIEDMSE